MTVILRNIIDDFKQRIGQDRAVNLYRSDRSVEIIDGEMEIALFGFLDDDSHYAHFSKAKVRSDEHGLTAFETPPFLTFPIHPGEHFMDAVNPKCSFINNHFYVFFSNGFRNSRFRICKYAMDGSLVDILDDDVVNYISGFAGTIGQGFGTLQPDINGNIYLPVYRSLQETLLVFKISPDLTFQGVFDTNCIGSNTFKLYPYDNSFAFYQTISTGTSRQIGYVGSDGGFVKSRLDFGFESGNGPRELLVSENHVFMSSDKGLHKLSKTGQILESIDTPGIGFGDGWYLAFTRENNIITSNNEIYSSYDLSNISSANGTDGGTIRKIGNEIFATRSDHPQHINRVDSEVIRNFSGNQLKSNKFLTGGIIIKETPPLPPPSISLDVQGIDLSLVWDAAEYATGYTIWIDGIEVPGTPIIPEKEGVKRFYTVEGISPGSHIVQIASVNEFGTGISTYPRTFNVILGSPINIVSEITSDQVKIQWDAVQYADGYNVYVGGQKVNGELITDTEYTVEQVAPGSYEVRVKAIFGEIESGSGETHIVVVSEPLSPPGNFNVEVVDKASNPPENFNVELVDQVTKQPGNFEVQLIDNASLIPESFNVEQTDIEALIPKNFSVAAIEKSELSPGNFEAAQYDSEQLIPKNFHVEQE